MSDTETVRVINGSTPLIKLDTKDYPRFYRDLKNDNTQTIFSSDTLPVDELAQYGYAVVNATPQPVGDSVNQGVPELHEDGEWYQTWVVAESDPVLKFNEARGRLLESARELLDTELAIGLPFTQTVGGKTITYHLQASERDRPNWLAVYQVALLRKSAGSTDVSRLRTYENTFVEMTPAEVVDVMMSLMTGIDGACHRYWAFKDAVAALAVTDDLPELPETFLA